MAVDEALLRSAQRGAPPTLRFYSWDGAWLSLGLAQRLDPARRIACREAGVGIVRRATGGLAVLHGADLTYAVAAPATALPAGLQATYALIGEALRAGLASLGIEAERSESGRTRAAPGGFDCFQAPAADEICVRGRKLAGSAQRRTGAEVLQHGSLRMRPDPPAARAAAGLEQEGATSLAELGFAVDDGSVRAACAAAFASVLGVTLEPARLDEGEVALARQLAIRRPADPEEEVPRGFSSDPVAGR